MGGIGSGRRPTGRAKRTVESHLVLDINALNRQSLLVPGRALAVTWRVNGELAAAVDVKVQARELEISYAIRRRDRANALAWIRYPVPTFWTSCRFGGQRPWLHCPSCNRRVVKLYLVDCYFLCRGCGHLTYQSQRQEHADRALHKANRIREQLGGQHGPLNRFPMRPARMRAVTYARLRSRALEAEQRLLATNDARLERLGRWIVGTKQSNERS